jgi:hypothetical protein
MTLLVSLVLLSPQNERYYCCGLIGRDRICLNKSHLCDVANHEREKFPVNEAVLQIMAPATKATNFTAYREPSLPITKLNTSQYESLMQENHEVADLNRILTAIKVARFEDEAEFEEVKARAAKKSELGMAFTPNKKSRRTQEELGLETELTFAINPTDRARLSVVPIGSAGHPVSVHGATWNLLIEYISMLDYRLPALQRVLTGHRGATEKRFADVEDELGLVVADMGDGGDVPGGPFTSMWGALATSLEENRALSRIITALAEQSKQVSIKVQHARQRAAQAAEELVGVRTSIVSLTAGERNSVTQIAEIHAQLFQLASLLGRLQREVQANAGSSPLPSGGHDDGALMCGGLPISDCVADAKRTRHNGGANQERVCDHWGCDFRVIR